MTASNGNGNAQSPPRKIVVVGGGIIGVMSAYYLSRHASFRRGIDAITLLEASGIAGGASGKAGGLLALWAYPRCLVPLSFRLHRELAEEFGGAKRWGWRSVGCGEVECLGRAVGGSQEGGEMEGEHVGLGKREGQGEVSSAAAAARLKKAGVPKDLDWLDSGAVKGYEAMAESGATAQVHPRKFTEAMAAYAAEGGVEIKTQARVTGIEYSTDGSAVQGVTYVDRKADQEMKLPATDIVVAAGPWTQRVLPTAPISGMRAHSVTIKPEREVSAYALFTQIRLTKDLGKSGGKKARKTEQTVTPEIYARPDDEVYACGDGDRLVPLPSTTDDVAVDLNRCQDIVDYVGSISAPLRNGEVTARQACYLPSVNASGSGGPLVGLEGTKGLVVAAGHSCWGIQNAPATGLVVSEFVFEGRARSARVEGLDPRLVM
ncbi:hypothetical protein B0A50_07810 [Salinomyces thailandicus]|uniref:FAD dependent oxidoreductase domain-containing protein n=1 Tax=Salinomyces thailandicus TaxID=706561 RepID=A0A4U0TLK8_9PEZI|nr:hypothetical protein B0A50_07810 [Salinomyces thailandica]